MMLSAAGLTFLVITALAAVVISPFILIALLVNDLRKKSSW
ncbi:hypothetical protein [Marinihelvus fidelis]|nr:hypothetical protein [Marinihelvus fidelis]